jgi:N-acyl-phosphatidylethanolamine-hydrolysing phospholipase D
MRSRALLSLTSAAALVLAGLDLGCSAFGRSAVLFVHTPREVQGKITHPVRSDARLAVLWVGHATTLLQIDDKVILTDPVFTSTVGQFSRRAVEPGIRVEDVPHVDLVLISHMHVDHLSLGTLGMLQDRIHRLVVPEGGLTYVPDFRFEDFELPTWRAFEDDGMRVTAVPVRHVGFRYGADQAWMTRSFTGYVIEYHGITVYYGGDTGYEPRNFEATAAKFPHIDLAILPIGPIEPRSFMEKTHEDPGEALSAFATLRARWMVPIHYATFINSFDELGDPLRVLQRVMSERRLTADQVQILGIGEQHVFIPSEGARAEETSTCETSTLSLSP